MARPTFRYSRWDGTQVGFDLDADAIFDEITDDLLYHGDLNAALRRLMQQGFEDDQGNDVQGMRELMQRLRDARRERLENSNLGGVYDEIAEAIREVVDQERGALDRRLDEARESGDARQQELAEATTTEKHMHLDMLPSDLAGQVQSLSQYDFESSEAQQRFEELMDQLRQQLAQQYFDQMAGAMSNPDPAAMQRTKDMMAALNELLEKHQRDEDTPEDFQRFMDEYGDFFPENPENVEELLRAMAERMAQMQAMLNSMTPEQRAQLQGLAEQLLEDMDLNFLASQLGQNLQQMFPQLDWDKQYDFSGDNPMGFAEAAQMMAELGDLDQLENLMQSATQPGALAEADLDRARELLGDDAARSLEQLSKLAKQLEEAGLIQNKEGRLELTPRGLRRIGDNALDDLFSKLAKDKLGRHELSSTGIGHERTYETKAYEWGDPFNLHIGRTVRNAVSRAGSGTPVQLTPEDFEIERTETVVRSSTVLMLDLSLSMPMRDNFLPAKKVAMALHALISGQYPQDYLGLVGFSKVAHVLTPAQLPEVSWDYDYGTNMQHGLQLARQLLSRQSGTKQIIMITDGEPTAHFEPGMSQPYFNYPPVQETIDATVREVIRCTKDDIRINTFMLDATQYLKTFIERISRMNGGRAFFTTPETLGDYVLVDFVEHKRALRTNARR
ncbi:VWA domain-containing protein [Acidimicrobiia bacterium EGI L10123]|uniref:vWA domain-containing protein n=1 Tax=Salinilacustrithrix flava TaxID=2957203 RepID=UPI003D7C1E1F|nr:VWA domain-containing protein [Acidimicrobiia bacterium EGI L10123]